MARQARIQYFCFLICLPIFLFGCVTLNDPEASQEYRSHVVGVVDPEHSVGQTIVSRRSRLENIEIWATLDPTTAAQGGSLTVELYSELVNGALIRSISFPFEDLLNRNSISIPINIQDDPPEQSYYLVFKTNQGQIQVYGRDEDAYSQGQAYIDGFPQDSDLSFRLSYDYDQGAVIEDIISILKQFWLIVPLLIVLWLPGRLIISRLNINDRLDGGSSLAIMIGLSMAVIPVMMFWTSILNIRLNRVFLWITAFLLFSALIYTIIRNQSKPRIPSRPNWGIELALGLIFVVTLFIRLAMVRDLFAPAWVDSVHHATITRLFLEQGGFPESYAPYLDLGTANYHAGFHSLLATFIWITGLDIHEAMLIFGQVMNALAVIVVYLFTVTLTKNRPAGLFAALVTGVMTPMPAYYTSWGRYTQLAGLLILPAAFALVLNLFRAPVILNKTTLSDRRSLFTIFATALCLAGLLLTHYRVALFFMLLLCAHVVTISVRGFVKRKPIRHSIKGVASVALAGGLAILITLPWWPSTISTLFAPQLDFISSSVPAFADFNWAYLTSALGTFAMIMAGLGLFLAIILRKGFILTLSVWVFLLFLVANLGAFSLPGAGFINNTSVQITLFIPISVLAGYLVGWPITQLYSKTDKTWRYVFSSGLVLAAITLVVVGARALMPILNPVTILFRQADRPALAWLEQNIPFGEKILINPFAWGYGLYSGSDGGYWITPLAGQLSIPPPVLYGLEGNIPQANYISEVSKTVIAKSDQIDELHRYLISQGIHYIYIGARGGALSPSKLQNSPLFKLLRGQDNTWIFQVLAEP